MEMGECATFVGKLVGEMRIGGTLNQMRYDLCGQCFQDVADFIQEERKRRQ